MPTVAFRSIGCRTNQQEGCALESALAEHGFKVVKRVGEADIVVVNSCCVTSTAEAKTRRMIASIARTAPHARVAVTGCLAQRTPELAAQYAGVKWVVGNSHKELLPRLLQGEGGVYWGKPGAVPEAVAASPCPSGFERTRLLVKIQEGCNYRCAYCVVPLVRGGSRSVEFERVAQACGEAIQRGAKEIVLTGTHIGQYADSRGRGLVELLRRLTTLDGDYRVRLSSLDPRDMSDELLDFVSRSPNVCRHVHLSVQSLSAPVLASMRRPVGDIEGLIARLRDVRRSNPEFALGGDFIVGFPTETDVMFDETVARVSEAGFTYGHVFRYSRREGTLAAAMEEDVPAPVAATRSEELRSILAQHSVAFAQSQVGSIHRVVVERTSPAQGISSNYLRVRVPELEGERNCWLDVQITSASSDGHSVCTGTVWRDRRDIDASSG